MEKSKRILVQNKGFTLVELIVVITILAILGTIAIMAFSGYSKNARDSARVSDISRIVSSIELFQVAKGFFPEPTNGVPVTYSGATAWIQGTFGDSTVTNVEKINKKPVDPLTASEYAYSITNAKNEFQIGAIYEGDNIASVIHQTYAAEPGKALVKGNYNGSILKVSTGSMDYILAIPSILASDIETDTDVVSIIGNDRLVFDKYSNLPASYTGTSYEVTGSFGYNKTEAELVVFSGSVLDLNDEAKQLTFFKNLQDAYVGTVVSNEPEIKNILAYDTVDNEEGSLFTAQILLNEKVSNSIKLTATNNNNAGGNTGGGGGGNEGGENPNINQGAGSFNYKFFESSVVPMGTNATNDFYYYSHWSPIEIAPGVVMILEDEGKTRFGFFNVASNGDITHLFTKDLSDVINIPEGWNEFAKRQYQSNNVLNLGGGKFIIITHDVILDNYSYLGTNTRYHLFQADVNGQSISYHDTYNLQTEENPTDISDFSAYIGAFIDDAGYMRVAYASASEYFPSAYQNNLHINSDIWMQKVSTVGNVFTVNENQKLFDLSDGEAFGFTANEYIGIKAIAFEKVSNNKGIFMINPRIYSKGENGAIDGDDDTRLHATSLYAAGVNFGTSTYSTGSFQQIISHSMGADWPIYTLPVGGDRVVVASAGYNSNDEPYVIVTKLNPSTLAITYGNPVILGNDGGYKFGLEKITGNSIIATVGTKTSYNYGDTIPNNIFPLSMDTDSDNFYDVLVIDNVSNITYPISDWKNFVFELGTGKSYRVEEGGEAVTEITVFEGPSGETSGNTVDFDGMSFFEIDLGVGNTTPISVTDTFSGHLGDYRNSPDSMRFISGAWMVRLASGQIYTTIYENKKYDGILNEYGEFGEIAYPHMVLTPQ